MSNVVKVAGRRLAEQLRLPTIPPGAGLPVPQGWLSEPGVDSADLLKVWQSGEVPEGWVVIPYEDIPLGEVPEVEVIGGTVESGDWEPIQDRDIGGESRFREGEVRGNREYRDWLVGQVRGLLDKVRAMELGPALADELHDIVQGLCDIFCTAQKRLAVEHIDTRGLRADLQARLFEVEAALAELEVRGKAGAAERRRGDDMLTVIAIIMAAIYRGVDPRRFLEDEFWASFGRRPPIDDKMRGLMRMLLGRDGVEDVDDGIESDVVV